MKRVVVMLMMPGVISAGQAVPIEDFRSYPGEPAGNTMIKVQTGDA